MVPEVRGRHRRPGYGEKNPLRLAQANGCRQSDWETCAGTVELRTSQAGERPLLPRFLGPDQGHDLPPPGHQIGKQPGLLVSQRLWLDPGSSPHNVQSPPRRFVGLGALAQRIGEGAHLRRVTTTTGRPTAGSVAAARISKPPSPPAPPRGGKPGNAIELSLGLKRPEVGRPPHPPPRSLSYEIRQMLSY